MYALEFMIESKWTRFALCGKRSLLEQIQNSFDRQEERRIVYISEFSAASISSGKAA